MTDRDETSPSSRTGAPGGVHPDPEADARNRRPGGMILLLAGIPTLAVIVSTVGLVLAAGGAGDLVRDDYYKAGLVVQRDVAAEQQATALGLRMDVAVLGDVVELRSAQPLPNELQLAFVHPAWAAKDVSVTLERVAMQDGDSSAHWRGRVATPLPNVRWTVIVTADGARWRVRGDAQLPGRVTLGEPASPAARTATRAAAVLPIRPLPTGTARA